MFWVQNRVIWVWFSTFAAPGLFKWSVGPEKSSQFDSSIFQLYWQEKIRTAPQTLWVCFRCKMELSGPGFQLCHLQVYSGGVWTRKSHPSSTETLSTVLSGNHRNCTPRPVWVSLWCRIDSLGPDFRVYLLWCFPGPKKSSKFDRNIFQPYWQETVSTEPQTLWVCIESKTESYVPSNQLFLLWRFPSPEKPSK